MTHILTEEELKEIERAEEGLPGIQRDFNRLLASHRELKAKLKMAEKALYDIQSDDGYGMDKIAYNLGLEGPMEQVIVGDATTARKARAAIRGIKKSDRVYIHVTADSNLLAQHIYVVLPYALWGKKNISQGIKKSIDLSFKEKKK